MIFKSPEMEQELESAPERLVDISHIADILHRQITGKEMCITCVLGDASGRVSATHKEHRAFDARIERGGEMTITEEQAHTLRDKVNLLFPISQQMQTCVVHRATWSDGVKQMTGALHFHFQISRDMV